MVDIVAEAERKHIGRQREQIIRKTGGEWKPGEDVEKLCSMLTNFLTSPANFAKYTGSDTNSLLSSKDNPKERLMQ